MNTNKKQVIFSIIAVLLTAGLIWWVLSIQQTSPPALEEGVVAKVGDKNVMASEFKDLLSDAAPGKDANSIDEELKKDVLNYLIEGELLKQKAEELGITVSDSDISEKIDELDIENTPESRKNAEIQVLRDKVYNEVITRRSLQYITVRFDRYFGDDFALSEEELERIRRGREEVNRQERRYADSVVNDLERRLEAGEITFEEAMNIVEEDVSLSPTHWEFAGWPLTGEVIFDGSFLPQDLKESPFHKAFEVDTPSLVGPYLHEMTYLKNPEDAAYPELIDEHEKIKKPGMWVILNVTEVHNGEALTRDEWLETQRVLKVQVADGQNVSFLNFSNTASAVHGTQSNHAGSCSIKRKINTGNSNQRGVVVARTLYMTDSGAGPYSLDTSSSMTQDGSGAYGYSGCALKTKSLSGSCFDFGEWCCGDSHNPHKLTFNNVDGYDWIHWDYFSSAGTTSRNKSFSSVSGGDASLLVNVVNGRTVYINVYAEQDPVEPECTSKDSLSCQGNDIYWFDSCGSAEALYLSCEGDFVCENSECIDPCAPQRNTYQCVDVDSDGDGDDIYWFNKCGERTDKKEFCGIEREEGAWDPYCKTEPFGDVWEERGVAINGCSLSTDICTTDSLREDRLKEECEYGCKSDACFLPEITASITAEPASGEEPLHTTLTAKITINEPWGGWGDSSYHIWWNCSNTSESISETEAACGALPTVSSGACAVNSNGYRCIGLSEDEIEVDHTYLAGDDNDKTCNPPDTPAKLHNAKLIAEKTPAPESASAFEAVKVDPLIVPDCLPPVTGEGEDIEDEITEPRSGLINSLADMTRVLLTILAPILAAAYVFAGVKMFTSMGNPAALATAKNIIIYATLGYGVVLFGWVLLTALS
ncbi:MAG: SurA N-terminal domain-containing protein [Candidatus Spechtbacterales bacterium]|nr:SurA N-terminal domain-containing protein [Candidatus Spechtbacterales bacterium]